MVVIIVVTVVTVVTVVMESRLTDLLCSVIARQAHCALSAPPALSIFVEKNKFVLLF